MVVPVPLSQRALTLFITPIQAFNPKVSEDLQLVVEVVEDDQTRVLVDEL